MSARRVFSIALLACGIACSEPASESATPEVEASADACPTAVLREAVGRRSVVFVLVDTLRRDRLGAHGGPAHTPVFDALAADGLRFERAWANAPWTKPSIATLFTGLHPSQHGVVSHPRLRGDASGEPALSDVVGSSHETLAEGLDVMLVGRVLTAIPAVTWGGLVADTPAAAEVLFARAVELAGDLRARSLELRQIEPVLADCLTRTEKLKSDPRIFSPNNPNSPAWAIAKLTLSTAKGYSSRT